MKSLILLFILTATVAKCLPVTKSAPGVCNSSECHKLSRILHSHLNESADPCDDWFLYACGKFAQAVPLKDGESAVDALALISIANEKRSAVILDDESLLRHGSKAVRKMKKLYDQCLNNSDENIAFSLRERLFGVLINHRESLIAHLQNASTLVPVKIPTIESIGHSIEKMDQREVCRSNVQYEYDFAFSRVFVDKYNGQEATRVARQVINSVHRALQGKVNVSAVNSNETLLYKHELAKLERNLVYPDWLLNDHELDSEYNLDEVENLEDLIRTKQGHPYWLMPITMVNAVFSPNQISKLTLVDCNDK